MKLTTEQLKGLGYVETIPGHWHKGNELIVGQYPEDRSVITPKPPRRIRQSTKPLMNKLEGEFREWLEMKFHSCLIYPQCVRFMLGNGIWYKPDFFIFTPLPVAFEVKGPFAHRGGFENLKVAAHKYQQIQWNLVWKEAGEWKSQPILP